MTPRTITLRLTHDDLMDLRISTDYNELDRAIARLTTWGMQAYDTVTVMRDGKHDLIALYESTGTGGKFVLGAVWHDGSFGFHS